MSKYYYRLLLIIGFILSSTLISLAQNAAGTIFGSITDEQGAAVAGARVVITNIATHVSQETVTDKEGNYKVILLPLGKYQVSAEVDGFKKSISSEESLKINQTLHIDLKLEIGVNEEVVEVKAQNTMIETVNPTLGQSVTGPTITNMPLNGRDVLDLALLQPGVTEKESSGDQEDFSSGNFSIAGSRPDSVTYLLDGGINNDLLDNGVVLNPNPDIIAEFRILTSNYTAEYGRNGGGVISIVTKSGTNNIHGSGFDFNRNDAFNANSFFNNRDGLPKDVLKRNQFGFTLGGPITIPSVINGKDRYFFFFGYQGQRQTQDATTGNITVFTPQELRGDFSHSGFSGGVDSGVAAFLKKYPFFQPNPALASRAIIDTSRINSVAQSYINNGLIPSSSNGLLDSQAGARSDADEETLKLDFSVTPKDKITLTLGMSSTNILDPFSEANVVGYKNTTNTDHYFFNLAYTNTISPSVLNELRFTTQRVKLASAVPAQTQPTAKVLGINITPDDPTGPPMLSFAKGLTTGFSSLGPTKIANNTFALTDTISIVKQKHVAKFGVGYSAYQNNTLYDFFVDGMFLFSGKIRNGGIGTGNDFADFLLGLPDFYFQAPQASSNIRSKAGYFFAQDEWHITKNFTLTYGLRYEYNQPKFDTQGRSFSLSLGQKSTVFPNAPTGLLFPGDKNAPDGANFSDKNDFAPRVGFAWDPFGKGTTSIRGGVGVFYDILKGEDNIEFNGQIPFYSTASLSFNPLASNPTREVNYLSNPFVAAGVPNPFPSKPIDRNVDFAKAGFQTVGGSGVYFVDPHLRTPYIYQFNLGIEHQLTKDISVEVDYVGSSSHKLTSLVDVNPYILGTDTRVFNTQAGIGATNYSYLYEFRNISDANYHSLEISLQKQFSENKKIGNTFFNLSYTLGHSIDNASGFQRRNSVVPAYDSGLFRASSDGEIRQRLTLSGAWELPLMNLWANGPKRLLKGWTIYPIVSYRTGFPLDIFAGLSQEDDAPGPSGAGDAAVVRANLMASAITKINPHNVTSVNGVLGNYYFNPNLFSTAGLFADSFDPTFRTYGTLPRNAFRGPGRMNIDVSLVKSIPIIEQKLRAEIRADFFNVLNHTEFNSPDININSDTFGQVLATANPRTIQFAVRLAF